MGSARLYSSIKLDGGRSDDPLRLPLRLVPLPLRLLSSMSRVQLALNVSDLDAAVAFYSRLFGTGPAKLRPGYANFAVADPPLKLVLIAGEGSGGTLNHLGVELGSTDEVAAARRRLAGEGLATVEEDAVSCCYAVQDKVWVSDPDDAPWEVYTVLADSETPPAATLRDAARSGTACCGATDPA